MRRVFWLAVPLALLAVPVVAAGQGMGFKGWGPRAGFRLDPDQIVVGAHLDLGDVAKNVRIMPEVSAGFGDDVTLISINPEVHYVFRDATLNATTWLYGGGGLNFLYANVDVPGELEGLVDDDDIGLSLTGGVEHRIGDGRLVMGEMRITLDGDTFFELVGGITFGR
jgi:hypothetical protein